MRFRRAMWVVGAALLFLPACVVVVKLLGRHPTWPAGKVFDLVAVALLGLAVLIVVGFGTWAESRKRKADDRERDVAANL